MVERPSPHPGDGPLLPGLLAGLFGHRWHRRRSAARVLRGQCSAPGRLARVPRSTRPVGWGDTVAGRRRGRAVRAVRADDRGVLYPLEGRAAAVDVDRCIAAGHESLCNRGAPGTASGTHRAGRRRCAAQPRDEGDEPRPRPDLPRLAGRRTVVEPRAGALHALRGHICRDQRGRGGGIHCLEIVLRAARARGGNIHAGVHAQPGSGRRRAVSDLRVARQGFRVPSAAAGGRHPLAARRSPGVASTCPVRVRLDGGLARRLPAVAGDIRVLPAPLCVRGRCARRHGRRRRLGRATAGIRRREGGWRGPSSWRVDCCGWWRS